ncbi:MAG TPA: alpha/beta hydrolase, partial [Aggregatilineaceae bacterium]|nr:alpha/beta hydrolase [Aggregatilineaceae bacterium]
RECAKMSIYKSDAAREAVLKHYDAVLAKWTIPYDTRLIPTRHGATHVITCGDPSAPPLVVLLGGNEIGPYFGLMMADYARSFRVYVPDMIGQPGKSAEARPGPVGYGEWLADVFEAFTIKNALLLGMSFGGWVALRLATTRPDLLRGLVLLAPAGIAPMQWGKLIPAILGSALLHKNHTEHLIKRFAVRPLNPDLLQSMVLIQASIKPTQPEQPRYTDDALVALNMPVLLLAGEQDPIFSARVLVERAQRLIPNVTAETISNAGHRLVNDQPDVIRARVEQFAG